MKKVKIESLRDGVILFFRSGAKGIIRNGIIETDKDWKFVIFKDNIHEDGCIYNLDGEVVDRIVDVIRK